ncbi:replication ATP-dependent helicase [Erysipelothrix sp. HDW6B]|uniref:DEAD/DEAH box helicase n=1 Tax=Erysipelothrix sp. HDW6B TaxID=2714929 RepID=UPI0014097801|nr:ATP-binding protein [Erysipelothrix sp. HDW6B]QIK85449.1 replication ATP-dependent helicase [Erysipelothrix sp. HDW6B]
MNGKQNVLDAWISIEQFSEGDIDLKEGGNVKYKQLPTSCENWTTFFANKLNEFKEHRKLPEKKVKNLGFTIFFDVFKFDNLINELSDKFRLPEEYRDDNNLKKFTYCLSFITTGDSFKLVDKSIFYTISGYAHRNGEFPVEISNEEDDLNKRMAELFEYDFEKGMFELIEQEARLSTQNYYEIQEDVTKRAPFLHSFYIDDLNLAKGNESDNINRYLFGFSGKGTNLDSNKESKLFNAKDITETLEPKNYPLGRFPSNPEWGLSLMQQVAVNVAINDKNNIIGVNGPPGTGKTTLLKDIFAELVVRQAYEICELNDKHLNETATYYMSGKIAQMPNHIMDKNILVASSNNGAVQNIVNELPQKEQIDNQFLNSILDTDYFANNGNWGMFAIEGGKSENRKKMIETVKQMAKVLKSADFVSNEDVYHNFTKQYKLVNAMRQDAQKIADIQKKLLPLEDKLNEKTKKFQRELSEKISELNEKKARREELMQEIDDVIELIETKLHSLDVDKANIMEQLELSKLNLEAVKQQKPILFWLLKIINHKSTYTYLEQLSSASNLLTELLINYKNIEESYNNEFRELEKMRNLKGKCDEEMESFNTKFRTWKDKSREKLTELKYRISLLKEEINTSNFKPLDLTQPYSNLQLDNPWFDESYRVEQTNLFIAAIAVRKQFLYENVKSLNGSWIIWNKIQDYATPEKKYLITWAWSWINFAIPVISTTFASFGGMFRHMGIGSIANLFIDEAGQATPQSAVGAVIRSKRIMAVGDPSQITPVVPLSNGIIGLIASRYTASENIVNGYSSVQTLVDKASQFGYRKTEEEWIGMPLWVHRRCLDPMFSISNEISYGGQMVLPPNMTNPGKGSWIDIKGKSDNKFVREQGEFLKSKISSILEDKKEEQPSIYIISPFKNVVIQLQKTLSTIGFKKSNVGTVHTFQGKEADIVYLVLGASTDEIGAARWAISEPNLMNVAATRAKKKFYIIGDKQLYKSFNSEVVEKTLVALDKSQQTSAK